MNSRRYESLRTSRVRHKPDGKRWPAYGVKCIWCTWGCRTML
jgi:hypothetical protein